MAWSEKEILYWIGPQLASEGLPDRLQMAAHSIVSRLYRDPGRSSMTIHGVLAKVYEELKPQMTADEWLAHIMSQLSDRQLLEAIYRKLYG